MPSAQHVGQIWKIGLERGDKSFFSVGQNNRRKGYLVGGENCQEGFEGPVVVILCLFGKEAEHQTESLVGSGDASDVEECEPVSLV